MCLGIVIIIHGTEKVDRVLFSPSPLKFKLRDAQLSFLIIILITKIYTLPYCTHQGHERRSQIKNMLKHILKTIQIKHTSKQNQVKIHIAQ